MRNICIALTVLLIISLSFNVYTSIKINDLKNNIQTLTVDKNSINKYINNMSVAYKNLDWNSVTLNASAYKRKIKSINEPVDSKIYLYTSYAYYKLSQNLQNGAKFELIKKGIDEIELYGLEYKDNTNAYFVKGLLLLNLDNDKYLNNLNEAINEFNNALKVTTDNKQIININHHIGVAYERIALLYRDKLKNIGEAKKYLIKAEEKYQVTKEINMINNIERYLNDLDKVKK